MHSHRRHRWRRFTHDYGIYLFVAFLVAIAVGLVAFLMVVLTSINWRPRW